MAIYGPQFGVKYVLVGPRGDRAVFNDPTDADYVGVLTDVQGLDSPEVRVNVSEIVQFDGAIQGEQFYGPRPVVLEGMIENPTSTTERNTRSDKLMRASNAMIGNATLTWTPDGGMEHYVTMRRAQPLRISGGWNKSFQASFVAADPRIYSSLLESQTILVDSAPNEGFGFPIVFPLTFGDGVLAGLMAAENKGNGVSYPVLFIAGPGQNPTLQNLTTDERIVINTTLAAGATLIVDTLNRTVITDLGVNRYSAVDYVSTEWWGLVPGVNQLRLFWFSSSEPASLNIQWRHATL